MNLVNVRWYYPCGICTDVQSSQLCVALFSLGVSREKYVAGMDYNVTGSVATERDHRSVSQLGGTDNVVQVTILPIILYICSSRMLMWFSNTGL